MQGGNNLFFLKNAYDNPITRKGYVCWNVNSKDQLMSLLSLSNRHLFLEEFFVLFSYLLPTKTASSTSVSVNNSQARNCLISFVW